MAVKFLVSIHGAVIIELHTRIAGAFALVHCRQALDLKALHAAEHTHKVNIYTSMPVGLPTPHIAQPQRQSCMQHASARACPQPLNGPAE